MESLFYILLYLLLNNDNYKHYDGLNNYEKKNINTITYLMQHTLNIQNINYEFLNKLFNYIRRLKYNQEPKYDYIGELLSKIVT